jgi:GNAT superfamily N-acetyltransferase
VTRYRDPVGLTADHTSKGFDCGVAELDEWLTRHGLRAQRLQSARVFVSLTLDGARVAGYYALAAGEIAHSQATEPVRRGMPRHPIPIAILARLAVDRRDQGRGLGTSLLRDAVARTARASSELGIRAILVHALDEQARSFYERFGFTGSPVDPFALALRLGRS